MEKLNFTRKQRDNELALFRIQQSLQISASDGVETAMALLQAEDTEAPYPHDIPLEHLPIYEALNALEDYAYREVWNASISEYLRKLRIFIRAVTHPDDVAEWKEEASFDQTTLGFLESGDDFNAFGNHYKGIIEDIFERAQARANLDDENYLTLREIALLAELNERSVMNAVHAKGASRLVTDGKDFKGRTRVDPATAREWLAGKDKFKPTKNAPTEQRRGKDPEITEEPLFIPESRDGSRFLPNLRNRNGFRIGPKGGQWVEEDYFEALRRLIAMETPSWSRNNSAGNTGVVSGIHWVKVAHQEIEDMLSE